MIDQVVSTLKEVAAEYVLPRFRNLAEDDISEKSPGDLVTIADRESEKALSDALSELVPGSLVVGEEAVAADPKVLERLSDSGPVWVIDPIDGTGNFAAGREPFALMVALLREGRPVLSVMYEPVIDRVAAAELGSGSYIDGRRVTMDQTPITSPMQLRGAILTKYLPPALKAQVLKRSAQMAAVLPGHHCAGREYPELVLGRQHFAMFWYGRSWDHAPGALFTREAGGVVRHFDGTDYDPTRPKFGLLVCRDAGVFELVRETLL